MDLAAEMVSYWTTHGYEVGSQLMQTEDVAATVVSVLASPVCLTSVVAYADPGKDGT